jgi:S1-C subfamily serine protease
VKSVSANGAAAQAGLHAGDRIVEIDGQPVHSLTDFRLALLDKKPGKHVRLRFQRGEEEMDVQLTLKP